MLEKYILELMIKNGMTVRQINGDTDFLCREEKEGFTYHKDGSITTFIFDEGERIFSDLHSEIAKGALLLLRRELFDAEEQAEIGDEGVYMMPYELQNSLTAEYLNNKPSAVECLLNFQHTPQQYIKTRKGRGGDVVYVDGNYMTRVLNASFAFDWCFEIIETRQDNDQLSVCGKLSANLDGKIITREQWGSQTILPKMEIGDALKGATTDAMKKCASTFGIASDVYGGEIEA